MLLGRLLGDRLDSVCRMLQSNKDINRDTESTAVKGKPFQPTQSIDGEFGFISLLEGRDTPRAVRTWMYSPKRQHLNSGQMIATSVPLDLHIYMDALESKANPMTLAMMEENGRAEALFQQTGETNTHRIHILKASHFLNVKGFYDYELVFWQDLALALVKGSSQAQERYAKTLAIKLTDILANRCLDIPRPLDMKREEWEVIMARLMAPIHAKRKSLQGLTA